MKTTPAETTKAAAESCPVCGRPFTLVEVVLSETDPNFQCPNCWNRVQAFRGRLATPCRRERRGRMFRHRSKAA